ncbi:hypothetical protein [Methanosarcina sp.]|uniref:hypothetical protein n=1 Tax=Methanosarcina sp. TaxID=2213 RepID=UPI003C75A0DE
MKQQLEQRIRKLKTEFEAGQKMLADLEMKQANLRDTLLRISGAIQVLEELNAAESSAGGIPEQVGQNPEIHAGRKIEPEIEAL